jgi:hypothetical protein
MITVLYSRFIKILFTILVIAALTTSCININVPGTGSKTPSGSGETTPPAGTGATVTNPPTIESFAASPENLVSGKSGTLSWSVKDADTIMITPDIGKVDASGSKTVKPANETTYTLVASNSAGMAARPVTIKIYTVRSLNTGALDLQEIGSGTQQGGSGKYIVGTLGTDLAVIAPDLQISDFKIVCDTSIAASFKCKLAYVLKNSGNASSAPMVVMLKIDDVTRSSDNVSTLASGASVERTFAYSLSHDFKTLHTVEIVADAGNANAELDENNNALKTTIYFR